MTFSAAKPRIGRHEDRGQDGEVLRHVIRDGEGGQRPARLISSCLPTSTTSISLVGSLSRSIRFAASFAAGVPEFIATPDIGLRQRRRVVRPVAAHRDQPPARLFAADQVQLHLGRRLGQKIVHPGLGGDGGGGQRVVAGDHHGADAHGAQFGEALAHAGLDDVLQVDRAKDLAAIGDQQGRSYPIIEATATPEKLSLPLNDIKGDEQLYIDPEGWFSVKIPAEWKAIERC